MNATRIVALSILAVVLAAAGERWRVSAFSTGMTGSRLGGGG